MEGVPWESEGCCAPDTYSSCNTVSSCQTVAHAMLKTEQQEASDLISQHLAVKLAALVSQDCFG